MSEQTAQTTYVVLSYLEWIESDDRRTKTGKRGDWMRFYVPATVIPATATSTRSYEPVGPVYADGHEAMAWLRGYVHGCGNGEVLGTIVL